MYIQPIIDLAKSAGKAILAVYNDPNQFSNIDYKDDNSPLTLADTASHQVIMQGLRDLQAEAPVISEEGKDISYRERSAWNPFWLVDPLDGTKEFIKRNGEFTVNIALIEDRIPTLGVIYAPATDTLYFGSKVDGAYRIQHGETKRLKVNHKHKDRIAVRSRSHANASEDRILDELGVIESVSIGSSLKFCLVAEGTADVYYRHGPTMEWDIAAGTAIVKAAGGNVLINTGDQEFRFNKPELLNGSFLCVGY